MKRLRFLFPMLLLLVSCMQEATPVPGDWLATGADKWTLHYPKTWNVDPAGPKPVGVAIVREIIKETEKSVMEITVTLTDFTDSGISVEEFVGAAEYKGSSMLPEFTVTHKGEESIASNPAQQIVYTTSIDGYLFKYSQYYLILDEWGVTLTFSAEEKYFAEYAKEAERILKSFTWHNKQWISYHPS